MKEEGLGEGLVTPVSVPEAAAGIARKGEGIARL
jgi:hypothetical protein